MPFIRQLFLLSLLLAICVLCATLYALAEVEPVHPIPASCSCSSDQDIGPAVLHKKEILFANNTPPRGIHLHPFHKDYVECPIKVFKEEKKLREYQQTTNASSKLCTPQLFQEYFKKNNGFYAEGAWLVPEETKPQTATFHPKHCVFNNEIIKLGNLAKCLKQQNIKKIFVLGDSNGFRLFQQVQEFFYSRSRTCELRRKQNDTFWGAPEPYFQVPGSPLMQKFKGCWECYSQEHICWDVDILDGQNTTQNSLIFEYIGFAQIIDRKLKVFSNEPLVDNPILGEQVFLEYLFQKYFPHHGFPDLWLLPAPMHHEAAISTYDKFQEDSKDFSRLLETYLPATTRLVLYTNIRMCPSLSGWAEIQRFYSERQLNKNEAMHILNQMLFDALREQLIKPGTNIYGFVELGELTCPTACVWHADGAHMVKEFYMNLLQYTLQLMCTEDLSTLH